MNYRHLYHAGCVADVMKHYVLTLLLQKLAEKETPFAVLDTHAGRGIYNLATSAAQKTREYAKGVGRLMQVKNPAPPFAPYLALIRQLNQEQGQGPHDFTYYPGSPYIARQYLRPQDRLLLSEWQTQECEALKEYFHRDRQVVVHHQDAYVALKALLPFPERRGLILIDPPFEEKDEFVQLTAALKTAYQKFATGMYAVWYPIKADSYLDIFYKKMHALGIEKMQVVEFLLQPRETKVQLNGCGMLFINPPWQLAQTLPKQLELLLDYLGKREQGKVTSFAL